MVFAKLPDFLQTALHRQGISAPTQVQQQAIGPILGGRDVLATAQTGTGKTLAFLLPLVVRLVQAPQQNALILSPTRELAQQTFEELQKLTDEEHPLLSVLIIGGDSIHKQFADLRKKPRVIVATPGRVIDHLQRKSIDLRHTHFLVLDETDRMLDMGFVDDMRHIVKQLPMPRQTLLFSATLPAEIVTLSGDFLTKPVRVQIGSVAAPAQGVLQEIVQVDVREKLPQLLHELSTRSGSVLIFTRTKHGAERLAKQLKLYGQKANALHGDLRQNRRRQVLEFFRNQTVRILVATDVAARGIDVAHIAHVINYDLPQCPEDYIHRVGRTGRAGAVGNSISFIAGDMEKWRAICKVTRFSSPVKTVQKTISPLPAVRFIAREEERAPCKNRPKKRSAGRVEASCPQTAGALLSKKSPQAQVPPPAAPKRPNKVHQVTTFQKSTRAAQVFGQHPSFRVVKVGAKKKAQRPEALRPQKKRARAFQKFSKRKRR